MGAGKSGLAQSLSIALSKQAIPVHWFYEMHPGNPVGRVEDATLPLSGPMRSLEQWRRFIDRWDRTAVAVIDGRLLNLNITNSLQAGRSIEETLAAVSNVVETLRNQKALLIHLVVDAVRSHVDRITGSRNDEEWFFPKVAETAFGRGAAAGGRSAGYGIIEQTQDVTSRLADSFPGDVLSVSIQNLSWAQMQSVVFRQIGSEDLNPSVPHDADSILGDYSLEMEGIRAQVTAREMRGEYTIEGHPFSSHPGIDDPLHLVPDGDGAFHIRSMPVSLQRLQSGSDRVMLIQKPWYPPWNEVEGVLTRIEPS